MQIRQLGWTDLELTPVGLGTWAIGGPWQCGWGEQDDEVSIRTIQRALDLGINWIDTAPIYGFGHSETIVGKAIKGLSSKPIIATKCGRVWDENRNISGCLRRESIFREVDASLSRLKVDVIDLYQIHWPDPPEAIEEGWDAIARCVKAGKIRYAGVSNFSPKQMEHIKSIHPIASCQPPYSMLRRYIEDDVLLYCHENRIGVIPYSPMQKGLLSGKITQSWVEALSEDDHRKRDPMFREPELSVNLDFVKKMKTFAESSGKTAAQCAIAWVLGRPEITAAIVGARRPGQIEETVQAGTWKLSDKDIKTLEELLSDRKEVLKKLV